MSKLSKFVTSRYDFIDLCYHMKTRRQKLLISPDGKSYDGIITGIRAEDGSGNCWLIKMAGMEREIFIRTN